MAILNLFKKKSYEESVPKNTKIKFRNPTLPPHWGPIPPPSLVEPLSPSPILLLSPILLSSPFLLSSHEIKSKRERWKDSIALVTLISFYQLILKGPNSVEGGGAP